MNVASRAELAEAVTSGRSGLVVVDPQHDFCSERGALAQHLGFDMTAIQQAVGRLNPLIAAWRAAALPVFWVREVFAVGRMRASHQALWGGGDGIWVIKEGSAGADWYAGIVGPEPGESVVTKWHFDAFEDTDLRLLLTARNIDTLIMTAPQHVGVGTRRRRLQCRQLLRTCDDRRCPARASHGPSAVGLGRSALRRRRPGSCRSPRRHPARS